MTVSNRRRLTDGQFEFLRDLIVVMSRRMSEQQMLSLADDLHTLLRRRGPRGWDERRSEIGGFS